MPVAAPVRSMPVAAPVRSMPVASTTAADALLVPSATPPVRSIPLAPTTAAIDTPVVPAPAPHARAAGRLAADCASQPFFAESRSMVSVLAEADVSALSIPAATAPAVPMPNAPITTSNETVRKFTQCGPWPCS
jgi:hypothetical protein